VRQTGRGFNTSVTKQYWSMNQPDWEGNLSTSSVALATRHGHSGSSSTGSKPTLWWTLL